MDYDYIIRAYKTQIIVLLFIIMGLFVYFYIERIQLLQKGAVVWGSPAFDCLDYFLLCAIIVLPINTLYLYFLNKLRISKVKIETNRSIAIFAIVFHVIYLINNSITNKHLSEDPILLYIFVVGISLVILNITFAITKIIKDVWKR